MVSESSSEEEPSEIAGERVFTRWMSFLSSTQQWQGSELRMCRPPARTSPDSFVRRLMDVCQCGVFLCLQDLQRTGHMPTTAELAQMKDDLSFKQNEMEKSEVTASGLAGGTNKHLSYGKHIHCVQEKSNPLYTFHNSDKQCQILTQF